MHGPNLSGKGGDITAIHLRMDGLADALGRYIADRPVLNRTHLSGEYQFDLKFAPRQSSASGRSSIFAALREQLGLQLRPGRVQMQVLLLEGATLPSE